jgi:hypothetical protein
MKQGLNDFIQELNLNVVISSLAIYLFIKCDKAISKGQAEAIIRHLLGIKLDSKGRSQLHEFRKKILKYKKLFTRFKEYDTQEEYLIKIITLGAI